MLSGFCQRFERAARQRSEQYLTSFHTFSHFFRQLKLRPQQAQIRVGSSDFLRIFGMVHSNKLWPDCMAVGDRGAGVFATAHRDHAMVLPAKPAVTLLVPAGTRGAMEEKPMQGPRSKAIAKSRSIQWHQACSFLDQWQQLIVRTKFQIQAGERINKR